MRLFVVLLPVLLLAPFFSACTKKRSANPNVLNLVSIEKIKGFDPALAQDNYSNLEILRVYEPLFQYHPFRRPYELEPLIAEAMPGVSRDGLVYSFRIRKGVFFHDDPAFPEGKGRELKAKDVEYSLKRLADPRVKATGFWILEGRVVGLDEWHAKYTKDTQAVPDYDEPIAGLRATGEYSLEIRLKQPYPQLLNALAMPYASVVPKEAVEKYGPEFMNHAVGTGAFILSEYAPGDRMRYRKNPSYWGKFPADGPADDAGRALPFVDEVNVRVIVEDQPRWLHFMKGELDRLSIPKDNFGAAVEVKDKAKPASFENLELSPEIAKKGIELFGAVGMDFTYDAFNLESELVPQFKDKRVRQAISLAVDFREAIPILYNGRATIAQTPVPPGINGHDPAFQNPYRSGDIEKARQLLAAAGYPDGKGFPQIPFDSLADSTSRQFADYIQTRLAKLGLKMTVVSNTWPAMLKRIQQRQAHFWGISWGADYPDAENFLQLFYGKNASPGGMNSSYYRNREFDALFEKARILPDSPARTEMYRKLGRMVAEDCPVVLGVHRIAVWLRQGWIRNDLYDEFPYPRAKYLKVDLDAKKRFGGS